MGKTVEGRDLWVIKVSNQLKANKNPAIFVDAGIHAREWIAPATALYMLNQITENPDVAAGLINGLDWYIVPVLNPDGYEFTHTKVSKNWISPMNTEINSLLAALYSSARTLTDPRPSSVARFINFENFNHD